MGKTTPAIVTAVLLGLTGCATAPAKDDLDASIRAAENVLTRFQADPAKENLRGSLKAAKAVLIVSPGADRGVVLARRRPDQGWSSPAFYRVTKLEAAGGGAGGAGFSAGKQNLEMIVLVMSDRAMNWLMAPKLPGTAGLAVQRAGEASGATGAPDVVLVSRSEAGAYAAKGNDLANTYVSIDQAGNLSYYGRPATPADILITQSVTNPAAASLQKAVEQAEQ